MNKLWRINNDPWDTYANWESWLMEYMSDETADQVCEIGADVIADIYGVFCQMRDFFEKAYAAEAKEERLGTSASRSAALRKLRVPDAAPVRS